MNNSRDYFAEVYKYSKGEMFPLEINAKQSYGRATGNTTRVIDDLVQQLFTKGECVVYDVGTDINRLSPNQYRSVLKLNLDKLIKRINLEHGDFLDHAGYKIEVKDFTVKLIKR